MRKTSLPGPALLAPAAAIAIALATWYTVAGPRPGAGPPPRAAPAGMPPGPDAPPLPTGPRPPGPATGLAAPIPQDTARMERRRRDRLAWHRRTTREAYDAVGRRDPRWDAPAREALDLAARMFGQAVDPQVTFPEVHRPAKAAVDAGCDDPLLVYLYHRTRVGPDYPGPQEAARRMEAAATALAASRYPAFRRAIALELAGTYALDAPTPDAAARARAERAFDAALALLSESVADDGRNEFWEDQWFATLTSLIAGYRRLGLEPPAAYGRVDAGLDGPPELEVLRLLVRGHFWFNYGWEARTTAFAPDVPAGGFEGLGQRLEAARQAFEAAWRLRPDDARAATYLLDIDKSVGGDRAAMEAWFGRAMAADGDRHAACLTKLDWLDPKWHGTAEEMVAFGRACLATGNWRAGITLLVGDAHLRHGNRLGPQERSRYLGSPEVWPEIRAAYDEYLAHYPGDDVARSKYAALGFLGGRYHEAHAQFEALGDRLTTWPTFPYFPLESLRRMREDAALVVVSGPG